MDLNDNDHSSPMRGAVYAMGASILLFWLPLGILLWSRHHPR